MEVISNTDISSEVVKLIEGAKKALVLVTPYFDPWERLTTAIKRAVVHRGINVVLLVRGGEDRAKQEEKTRDLASAGVKVVFLSRLHAKIYLSEQQAIVTSMNLLKSSALDSWEIAIKADKQADAEHHESIVKCAKDLLQRAVDEHAVQVKEAEAAKQQAIARAIFGYPPAEPAAPETKRATKRAKKASGFCIRCSEPVDYDPDQPLCTKCHRAWSKFENPDYKENFCHACGDEKVTTFAKPLCKPCWEAAS